MLEICWAFCSEMLPPATCIDYDDWCTAPAAVRPCVFPYYASDEFFPLAFETLTPPSYRTLEAKEDDDSFFRSCIDI